MHTVVQSYDVTHTPEFMRSAARAANSCGVSVVVLCCDILVATAELVVVIGSLVRYYTSS